MESERVDGDYQVWVCKPHANVADHRIVADGLSVNMANTICSREQKRHDSEYIMTQLHGGRTRPAVHFYVRQIGEPTYNIVVIMPDKTKAVYRTLYTKTLAKQTLAHARELYSKYNLQARVIMKKIDHSDERGEYNQPIIQLYIGNAQQLLLQLMGNP